MFYITQPCGYQLVAILAGGRVIQPPVSPRYICALQVGIFGLRHIDEAASLIGALCAVLDNDILESRVSAPRYVDQREIVRNDSFHVPTINIT